MKVRFFPEYGFNVPGSRYRVYYISEEFNRMGIENEIVTPVIPTRGTKYVSKKFYLIAKNIWSRFFNGVRRTRNTVLFIHRGQGQHGFYLVFFVLKRIFRKRIVFDFDDAIFLQKPGVVKSIVRASDAVIVGSHFLEEYSKRYNEKTYIIPTSVRIPELVNTGDNKQVVVGWVGGTSTSKYLDVLVEPLDKLSEKHNILFRIFGLMGQNKLVPGFKRTKLDIIDWVDAADLPGEISRLDIGVMPLHDTMWERGKCSLKALEYMSLEIPTVCSAIGENNFVIEHGRDGFLCKDSGDWISSFNKLIASRSLRREIGKNGRIKIKRIYSIDNNAKKLSEILMGI
jgi:glycosyltransferase involved in cell wall biosynthesis